jgi:hypothetical protein
MDKCQIKKSLHPTADPCCMSMLDTHASFPCFKFMLHAHVSMLPLQAAEVRKSNIEDP